MVDTDPDPSPKPGARRLRRYWVRGPGAAKIMWGTPGDFDRCVAQLGKYVTDPKGLCNVYHRSAIGAPPGQGHKSLWQGEIPEQEMKRLFADVYPDQVQPEIKREFSTSEREGAADRGFALADGSFPIKNVSDLKNAIHAFGRAKDKARAKRHIIKRARSLGATNLLPETWNVKTGFPFERIEIKADLGLMEQIEDALELKVRRVRTPAGANRFGQPIGSIIVRDVAPLRFLQLQEPKYEGFELVQGTDGKQYDVGKHPESGKWIATETDGWDSVVESDTEDGVYEALDAYVGKSSTRAGRPDPKPAAPDSLTPAQATDLYETALKNKHGISEQATEHGREVTYDTPDGKFRVTINKGAGGVDTEVDRGDGEGFVYATPEDVRAAINKPSAQTPDGAWKQGGDLSDDQSAVINGHALNVRRKSNGRWAWFNKKNGRVGTAATEQAARKAAEASAQSPSGTPGRDPKQYAITQADEARAMMEKQRSKYPGMEGDDERGRVGIVFFPNDDGTVSVTVGRKVGSRNFKITSKIPAGDLSKATSDEILMAVANSVGVNEPPNQDPSIRQRERIMADDIKKMVAARSGAAPEGVVRRESGRDTTGLHEDSIPAKDLVGEKSPGRDKEQWYVLDGYDPDREDTADIWPGNPASGKPFQAAGISMTTTSHGTPAIRIPFRQPTTPGEKVPSLGEMILPADVYLRPVDPPTGFEKPSGSGTGASDSGTQPERTKGRVRVVGGLLSKSKIPENKKETGVGVADLEVGDVIPMGSLLVQITNIGQPDADGKRFLRVAWANGGTEPISRDVNVPGTSKTSRYKDRLDVDPMLAGEQSKPVPEAQPKPSEPSKWVSLYDDGEAGLEWDSIQGVWKEKFPRSLQVERMTDEQLREISRDRSIILNAQTFNEIQAEINRRRDIEQRDRDREFIASERRRIEQANGNITWSPNLTDLQRGRLEKHLERSSRWNDTVLTNRELYGRATGKHITAGEHFMEIPDEALGGRVVSVKVPKMVYDAATIQVRSSSGDQTERVTPDGLPTPGNYQRFFDATDRRREILMSAINSQIERASQGARMRRDINRLSDEQRMDYYARRYSGQPHANALRGAQGTNDAQTGAQGASGGTSDRSAPSNYKDPMDYQDRGKPGNWRGVMVDSDGDMFLDHFQTGSFGDDGSVNTSSGKVSGISRWKLANIDGSFASQDDAERRKILDYIWSRRAEVSAMVGTDKDQPYLNAVTGPYNIDIFTSNGQKLGELQWSRNDPDRPYSRPSGQGTAGTGTTTPDITDADADFGGIITRLDTRRQGGRLGPTAPSKEADERGLARWLMRNDDGRYTALAEFGNGEYATASSSVIEDAQNLYQQLRSGDEYQREANEDAIAAAETLVLSLGGSLSGDGGGSAYSGYDRQTVLRDFANGKDPQAVLGPDRPRAAQDLATILNGIKPTQQERMDAALRGDARAQRKIDAWTRGTEFFRSAYYDRSNLLDGEPAPGNSPAPTATSLSRREAEELLDAELRRANQAGRTPDIGAPVIWAARTQGYQGQDYLGAMSYLLNQDLVTRDFIATIVKRYNFARS